MLGTVNITSGCTTKYYENESYRWTLHYMVPRLPLASDRGVQTPNIGQSVASIGNISGSLIASTSSQYASSLSECHTGQNIVSAVSKVAQKHKVISQAKYDKFRERVHIAFDKLFAVVNLPIDDFLQCIIKLDLRDILLEKIENSTGLSENIKRRLTSWHEITKRNSVRLKYFQYNIHLISLRTVLAIYFLNRHAIKDGRLYFSQFDIKMACDMHAEYVAASLCIAPLAWEKYSKEVEKTFSHLKITAIEKSLNRAKIYFADANDNAVKTPNIGHLDYVIRDKI